jgi:hypothetical protein
MNRNQFIEFLQRPEKLGSHEAQMLEKVIEEFPYCQAAHVLYLKALHNEKHINYNSRLKLTSAYTSERKMLYKFIIQDELKKKISKAESEIEEKPVVKILPVKLEPKPVAEQKEIIPSPEKPSPKIEIPEIKQEEIISKAEPAEVKIAKPEVQISKPAEPEPLKAEVKSFSESEKVQPEAVKEEISETSDLTDLEQEVLKEAVNAVIEQELLNTEISSNPVTITQTDQIVIAEKEITETESVVEEVSEPKKSPVAQPLPDDNEKLSFTDWLKRLKKNEINSGINKDVKVSKPENVSEPIIQVVKQEEENGEKKLKSNPLDLIEKFIKEEPRIKPKKTEFFSPVNMARMSVVEKDDFVTETLAKVYAKQGNTQKAIKAYENLILKYPQKTAYFAALIKELKEKK